MDKSEDTNEKGEIAGMIHGFTAVFAILFYLDMFNVHEPNPALFMTFLFTIVTVVFPNTISAFMNRYTNVSRNYMTGIGIALVTVIGAVFYIEGGYQREIQFLTVILLTLYTGYANIHYVGQSWTSISTLFFAGVMIGFGLTIEINVFLTSENPYFSSSGRVILTYLVFVSTYGFSHCSWKYARPFWVASLALLTLHGSIALGAIVLTLFPGITWIL